MPDTATTVTVMSSSTPPRPAKDRAARRHSATPAIGAWNRLSRPLQVLVVIAMAAGVVLIYNDASGLIGHVFNVVLLFLFAAIVALILTPVVDLLQRVPGFRSHRGPAVLSLYLVIFAAIGTVVALVIPNLVDQAKHIPQLVSQLQRYLADRGIDVNLGAVLPSSSSLPGSAVTVVAGVATTVADIVLVVVISIYLLIDGRGLVATLRNLFPENPHRFDFALVATGSTMAAYVRGQSLMSLIIGAYTALTLTLLGVHYAIVIGVAAFLLEFVPIIGAVLAMVLAVIVALLQGPLARRPCRGRRAGRPRARGVHRRAAHRRACHQAAPARGHGGAARRRRGRGHPRGAVRCAARRHRQHLPRRVLPFAPG